MREFNHVFDVLAMVGGHFGALRIIAGFFLSFWVPLVAALPFLQSMFWIDHNLARPPQTAEAMKNKSTRELREEALETIKGRKRPTFSVWDKTMLIIEAHFKNLTFFPQSKVTRIVGDGMA